MVDTRSLVLSGREMETSKYNPDLHHPPSSKLRRTGRRSIRLKGHDYAGDGLYFVTLCAHREAGDIFSGEEARAIVEACWRKIPEHFPHVEAKDFVVMPDHVHGIVRMAGASQTIGAKNVSPVHSQPRGTSRTLGSVVRGFKVGVSKWFRQHRAVQHVWQRNYYEMIVRSVESERKIAEYIRMNPWKCVQQFGNGLRGIGNPALWNAEKLGVLCSRNAPRIGHIPEAAVYFGGWHSPKEQEILDWLLEKERRIIACPAWGIGVKDVSPVQDALEENRMLILEMRNREGNLAAAEQRNRFVIEHADELFVPYMTSGGMLERILKESRR